MVWCLINLSGEPGVAHSDPTYWHTHNQPSNFHCTGTSALLTLSCSLQVK